MKDKGWLDNIWRLARFGLQVGVFEGKLPFVLTQFPILLRASLVVEGRGVN